jgi:potassium efflux system protein
LLATIEDYRTFIVGNLFWLRVTQPSGPVRFGEGAAATVKLLADAPWQASLAAVSRMIAKEPLPWLGVAAVVGLLLAARPRCGRGLSRIAARVADDRSDRFTLSLEATLITALLAAPLPLAMWFVYRQLTSEDSGDLLAAAVGSGFYRLFQLVILVSATLALTRRDGLAVVHFGWSERIRGTVRRAAWILSGTVAPMLFLSSILVLGIDAGPAGASASQTLTMVAAIGWTITLAGLARPDRGLVPLGAASRGPWEKRFRRPSFALAVGVPLVLTIASWQGYLFAAIIGMEKIASSLLVLLGVRTARELCLRWIAATTRTIERQRESSPAEIAPNPPSPAEPQLEFDLGATNVQAGRVIGSIAFTVLILGTLAVWSDLLPALDGLKRIELWSIAEPAAAGAAATRVPVNLLDALSSALALLLTVIFTRNMPGLIELIVLPRLPLEAGARYAIVTIIRYAIGIVGGVVVLRFLGVNWNSVQWLASAAVLGLSFGLQEIFKNLVSGVILLFEQPIRVGDRVSIGGVSGSVTSIRMRATTVVDSDLRDLIIPNSAFITGTVTNWTLSDLKTQQTIRIPVAYGSDARVVEEALLKIALAEPEVARNPAPTVTLAEFGEKSMHFDLSVEIDDIAKMPAPAHRIRLAAAEELPKLGVKLAGGG